MPLPRPFPLICSAVSRPVACSFLVCATRANSGIAALTEGIRSLMGLRLLVVSFLGASASFGLTNQNPCAHPDNSVMGMSALERAHGGALP